MKKIFSLPLNVNIPKEKFKNFKTFLKKYNHVIYDVYFTYAIPPFTDDAYGGISQSKMSNDSIYNDIDSIMSIQSECGVSVSATFNNIYVSPDMENMKLFIDNFETLYVRGVRNITLPFSSWVYSKEILQRYPGLFIKNTVMWKVHSAREFWNLAETGFDYINLDRTLIRNQKVLSEISEARDSFFRKTGKRILLSILANEFPCSGFCPFREEHSALSTGGKFGVSYFPSIFNICLYNDMNGKTENGIKMNFLKMAFAPPFSEDFDQISQVIDVFKLFGRIQRNYFQESLNEIENYVNGKGFLSGIKRILEEPGKIKSNEVLVKAWRKEIMNCNFNCWKCQLCDQIYENLTDENKKKLVEYKVY